MKPGFQLAECHVRHMAFVENREWQAKLGAELLEAHLRAITLSQNIIGRLPHRWQIIHQRARPIKDDVPNHSVTVTASAPRVNRGTRRAYRAQPPEISKRRPEGRGQTSEVGDRDRRA